MHRLGLVATLEQYSSTELFIFKNNTNELFNSIESSSVEGWSVEGSTAEVFVCPRSCLLKISPVGGIGCRRPLLANITFIEGLVCRRPRLSKASSAEDFARWRYRRPRLSITSMEGLACRRFRLLKTPFVEGLICRTFVCRWLVCRIPRLLKTSHVNTLTTLSLVDTLACRRSRFMECPIIVYEEAPWCKVQYYVLYKRQHCHLSKASGVYSRGGKGETRFDQKSALKEHQMKYTNQEQAKIVKKY